MTAREVGRALLSPYAVVPEGAEPSRTKGWRRRRQRRSLRPGQDPYLSARSNFDPPGIGRYLR